MFKHFFYCCQSNENKDPAIIVDTNNNSNNCQISTNTLNNDNTGKIDDHMIETFKNIENNQLGVNIHDKEDNKNIFSNKLFNSTFENKNKLLLNTFHYLFLFLFTTFFRDFSISNISDKVYPVKQLIYY